MGALVGARRPGEPRWRRWLRWRRSARSERHAGQLITFGCLLVIAAVATVRAAAAAEEEARGVVGAQSMFRRLSGGGGGNSTDDDDGVCGGHSDSFVSHLNFLPSGKVSMGMALGQFAFALYIFLGVASICDDYFGPSLEEISEALQLSPDVAGATFLAAGSSAPELFTSLSDAFASSSGVGLGTIVGSAMFNLLVIVALSAVAAGAAIKASKAAGVDTPDALQIDWRPLARDGSYYLTSIIVLCLCLFDGKVQWYEALIMVLIYALYIVHMMFNEKMIARLCPRPAGDDAELEMGAAGNGAADEPDEAEKLALESATDALEKRALAAQTEQPAADLDEVAVGVPPGDAVGAPPGEDAEPTTPAQVLDDDDDIPQPVYGNGNGAADAAPGAFDIAADGESAAVDLDKLPPGEPGGAPPGAEANGGGNGGEMVDVELEKPSVAGAELEIPTEDDEPPEFYFYRLLPPEEKTPGAIVYYVMAMPFLCMFAITVPDCAHPKAVAVFGKGAKWLCFTMSIVWIMILCHYMVEGALAFGCTVNIPPLIMGQCFLAIGTSVPDAIASVLAAQGGEADMAIANAIGSNVFDVLLGLGLPWFIVAVAKADQDLHPGDGSVEIGDLPLWPDLLLPLIILFSTVFFFVMLLLANKCLMNTRLGAGLFLLYFVYFVYLLCLALV